MVNNRNASLDPRGRAAAALALMTGDDFPGEAGALLDALGYASDRTTHDQTGDPAEFLANAPDTQAKLALVAEADGIRLLRQVADAEIAASAPPSAGAAFDGGDLYEGERVTQGAAADSSCDIPPLRVGDPFR